MLETLNRNIKEILKEIPSIAQILLEYGIGCSSCTLGTCRLRDIVDIHNLAPEKEEELMARIAGVIFPGSKVVIPKIERKMKPMLSDRKLSPPLRELVEEHKRIMRFISLIHPHLERAIAIDDENRSLISGGIEFIRTYADAFHHAKEEAILFEYFDRGSDIISSFVTEHETGRGYVGAAAEAVAAGDVQAVTRNLSRYADLLTEHIKKEDEILYPWMNRSLSDQQVGQLFSRFSEVNVRHAAATAKQMGYLALLEKVVPLRRRREG